MRPQGPGHFEIAVVSAAFEGKNRVKQHQLVYGAIADLMAGQTWAAAPMSASWTLDGLERAMGFEPTTSTLARLRSTPELRPHVSGSKAGT